MTSQQHPAIHLTALPLTSMATLSVAWANTPLKWSWAATEPRVEIVTLSGAGHSREDLPGRSGELGVTGTRAGEARTCAGRRTGGEDRTAKADGEAGRRGGQDSRLSRQTGNRRRGRETDGEVRAARADGTDGRETGRRGGGVDRADGTAGGTDGEAGKISRRTVGE